MKTQREFSLQHGGLITTESGTEYRGATPAYTFDKSTGQLTKLVKGIPWVRVSPRRHEKN